MAVDAAIVWEVRTTGSDSNGGGFKAGASGTDRSQQDAAQVIIDNSTITTSITTTVITFTAGYVPTSADVGNIVQMLTGTNVTAGHYEIISQDATTWTVDRNVVTSGTTTNATGRMGGCLASPGKAGGAKVAGNTVWIQSGTYSCSASSNVANGRVSDSSIGVATGPSKWIGYGSARGDNGTKPLLRATANSVTIFTGNSGSYLQVDNIEFGKSASETNVVGITISSSNGTVTRCKSTSITNGFVTTATAVPGTTFRLCQASSCSTVGFNCTGSAGMRLYGCVAIASGATGGIVWSSGAITAVRCVSINATSSGPGFIGGANGILIGCVAYGNNGNGFTLTTSGHLLINCISYGNGAEFVFTADDLSIRLVNCGGTSNNAAASVVESFVTLTVDPFTSAAGLDFSLNNTAGGGAGLRETGYPSTFPGLAGTSYLDEGAYQHPSTVTVLGSPLILGILRG